MGAKGHVTTLKFTLVRLSGAYILPSNGSDKKLRLTFIRLSARKYEGDFGLLNKTVDFQFVNCEN